MEKISQTNKSFWSKLLRKDPFGNYIFLKRLLIGVVGSVTYGRYMIRNKLVVKGTEHIVDLPPRKVLFLSNHQTYFADAIALYHIFSSVKWRIKDSIRNPFYLLWPRANNYYVAASETMKGGFVPKLLSLAGAVTVERSWRADGKSVARTVDTSADSKIGKALSTGWVISFPQGTTSPYAPIRKGTAHLIKKYNPIVIPVEIDGFRRAFDKKGLFFKKKNTEMSVTFKEPLIFDHESSIEDIVKVIETSIGQSIPEGDWARDLKQELEKKQEEQRKRKEEKKLQAQMKNMGNRSKEVKGKR
ncbi:lysophospholipid acyltransferase family protein [Algivirga pacifica]|uniref:Lysophospholipid acyltransferase family protein n=1 Tax=Algivirga pacifica TaxID=1162670 RepID=A0ABP9DG35_9BACT